MDYTDLQLVEAFILRRDEIKRMQEDFKKQCAPFYAQMDTIENEMLRRLNERGADHSATDAGTAFKVRSTQVQCEDKKALFDFAFGNPEWGYDLLTANVSKETLNLYMDKTKSTDHPGGLVPPGLKVNFVVGVQFRKA